MAWADTADANGVPTSVAGSTDGLFDDMVSKIQHFGQENNRRVCYIIEVDKDPRQQEYNPMGGGNNVTIGNTDYILPDTNSYSNIQFVTANAQVMSTEVTKNPVIWETEPNQVTELDIYYEASNSIPTKLTDKTNELFAPRGCKVVFPNINIAHNNKEDIYLRQYYGPGYFAVAEGNNTDRGFNYYTSASQTAVINYTGKEVRFYRPDGSYTTGVVTEIVMSGVDVPGPEENPDFYLQGTGQLRVFKINTTIDVSKNVGLGWHNCFTHNNGIESNRIRDDFNEMTITNGARVSATLEEPYSKEHRKHGLIYSGIYNSNSGVNDLNQFIMAEKITKDLNPTYGSIQKLFSRATDLVALCEDRVIKILANKDAVFNADGSPQLIASANVLGQATPFVGDYGISKNPASFASDSYRAYFTDQQRSAVLRLSMDGLTPISDAGMRDYFRDNLADDDTLHLGTFDNYKKQYNLTIRDRASWNVIENSFIDVGDPLLESTPNTEIVVNGGINGGSELSTVDIGNSGLFNDYSGDADGGTVLNPLMNTSFNHTTTIKNHPAIHVNDILQGQIFEQGWSQSGPTFIYGENTNTGWVNTHSWTGGSSVLAGYRNPFNAGSNQQAGSTHSPGGIGNTRCWYSRRTFDGGNTNVIFSNPAAPQAGDWSGIKITKHANSGDWFTIGKYYTVPDAGNAYPYSTPDSQSALHDVSPHVWNWTVDPENTATDDDDYSGVRAFTVFNGEEFRVRLKVRANSAGSVAENSPKISIQLVDGNDDIDDNLIITPGWSDGSGLPYNEYGAPQSSTTEGSGSYYIGFHDSGFYEWDIDTDWSGSLSSDRNYDIWFKFGDGTTDEKILIDHLKARITVTQEDEVEADLPELVFTQVIFAKRYRLWEPENPGKADVPEIPSIPSADIPAWAEVIHNPPADWSNWNPEAVDLTYGGTVLYGDANPPTQETQTHDGVAYNWISGTDNSLTTYNQYPGSAVTGDGGLDWYNGGDYEEVIQDVQWDASKISIATNTADGSTTSASIVQDISGDNKYKLDHWYLVDVWYVDNDPLNTDLNNVYIPGVLGNSPEIHQARLNDADHTDDDPNYPNFHFGQVTGSSGDSSQVKSLRLMPVTRTEYGDGDATMLRGIFQYKADMDGDLYEPETFRLSGWGADVVVKSIYLIDISETPTMVEPDNWSTEDINFQVPHAYSDFITANTTSVASPEVYYKDGKLCWDTQRSGYLWWNQGRGSAAAPDMPGIPSNDGYKFEFDVSVNPDTGTIDQRLWARVSNQIGDFTNDEFAGVVVTEIDTVGHYSILFNFDDSTPTILEKPDGSGVTAQNVQVSNIVDATNSGSSNKITFYPHHNGFVGAVDNVSVTDTTNYFTGGSVDSWNFTGFDRTVENWIAWDNVDNRITFNDAPGWGGNQTIDGVTTTVQANQRVFQHLDITPQLGDYYRVKFDYHLTSGAIQFYYYDSKLGTAGFTKDEIGPLFADDPSVPITGTYDAVHQIGETTAIEQNSSEIIVDGVATGDFATSSGTWSLLDAFVVTLDSHSAYASHDTTNGWVDNFVMKKVPNPQVDIATVSFSEDVKGWTSFKSFIPDSGVSLNSQYYTMKNGELFQHYTNESRNCFYGESLATSTPNPTPSSITVILNQSPSSVKSFKTINYEGTQGKVNKFGEVSTINSDGDIEIITDLDTYNYVDRQGWEVDQVITDLQKGSVDEFIKKEGKWFNYIKGALNIEVQDDGTVAMAHSEATGDFTFQGLGIVGSVISTSSDVGEIIQ